MSGIFASYAFDYCVWFPSQTYFYTPGVASMSQFTVVPSLKVNST